MNQTCKVNSVHYCKISSSEKEKNGEKGQTSLGSYPTQGLFAAMGRKLPSRILGKVKSACEPSDSSGRSLSPVSVT